MLRRVPVNAYDIPRASVVYVSERVRVCVRTYIACVRSTYIAVDLAGVQADPEIGARTEVSAVENSKRHGLRRTPCRPPVRGRARKKRSNSNLTNAKPSYILRGT